MYAVLGPPGGMRLESRNDQDLKAENTYTAPKKHPTSYKAVTVPRSEVCSGPDKFSVSRKSGVTITPPTLT